MAPHHKSMLSEIIGRETDIPVLDVKDGLIPKPNTLYITPPNQNIIVEGNKIRLVAPNTEPGAPKPSVDVFFKSLAEEKGNYAVGIILSGTGSDGAKGITAIKQNGGITIAQDELTAKYSSMPTAALQSGLIDLVMSPEEIGAQISKITAMPRDLNALRASPLSTDGVSELIRLLLEQTKVNFRHYKTATFQRRVERRMAAHNTTSLDDYVTIAKASQSEVKALFGDLLISVTSFFRDPVEFEALRAHIDRIVKRKTSGHIRIWVTGSATGEESYSLAMLFSEALANSGAADNARLQVFATDIDQNAIEVARRGFYPEAALEQVPDELVKKYFDRAPSGYTVKKMLREKMVFSYHNIAQDPPFLNMDMVSCRNLLIYFQANLQAEVFNRIHYCLVPHGILFLGKSEAVSASPNLFKATEGDKHIFTQRPSQERRAPRDMVYERPPLAKPATQLQQTIAARDLKETQNRMESLIKSMGDCALLVDSETNVIKGYGDLQPYVALSEGLINTKASSLVKEPYRQDIQAAVPGVIRNKKVSRGLSRTSPTDDQYREKVTVFPIENGSDDDVMALAVFERWRDETPVIQHGVKGDDSVLRRQMESLSNELAIAKTNLQQTVEELETSNEELQALNEELQSSNEELQSTNEELETSNEELQSTNEELSTVNEELQVNATQLAEVNQNLTSVLENISLPLLVVDQNLHITNVSGVAEEFFGIKPDLTLPHISRCKQRLGFPDMTAALTSALQTGEPMQWQVSSGEESATMKIVPHFSGSNELVGAIVIVTDNTQELKQANHELQLIFDNVPAAIMVRDEQGLILQANKNALGLLGNPARDPVGTSFYGYFDEEVAAELARDDETVIATGEPMPGKTQRIKYRHGKEIWARMSRIPAEHPQTKKQVIYAVKQDITEQHAALEELRQSEIRLAQAVKAASVGLWDWDVDEDQVYLSDLLREMLAIPESKSNNDLDALNSRIHPDDLDLVTKTRAEHFETKQPHHIAYRIRRDDGKYIWVDSYGETIWDEEGKPVRFVGTLRDVTAERSRVEALHEQKEQLELAAMLSGIGYWKIDLLAETLLWSDQVHQIHGTDSKTFQPTLETGIDFYHPDDRSRIQSYVSDAIETGKGFSFEARLLRADKQARVVRAIGAPDIDDAGVPTAVFGVFQDITEVKRREDSLNRTLAELARSNEELNRFSYVCSHDMKEPVRMIESMANLLINPAFEANEGQNEELLNRISVNTSRLRGIIDSLLAYSRIDAKIEFADVDLNTVLNELLDGLALVIEEANADIRVAHMPTIRGAAVHFTQLFYNLITNALKFNDKPDPIIDVSVTEQTDNWRFLVEDNGPGIAAESREEIFNLFSRLQRRDEVEGTGLGLSIAQRIVGQYGGSISCCDSAYGGIGFEIILPRSTAPND